MSTRETIFGPPGSGKTTAMTGIVWDAVESGILPERIVVCSLTKTAAKEITSRISQRCELEHVGTIHALARRALVAAGYKMKMIYKPELITEFNKTYKRSLPPNLGRALVEPTASLDVGLLAEMDRRRSLGMNPEQWPINVRRFASEWEAFKAANNAYDFTDLVNEAKIHVPAHPADPDLILVDEAQDLSSAEIDLIELWASHASRTVMAGDDQQALYEWRGASVDRFIGFADEGRQTVLSKSYRMTDAVHRNACRWGDRITVKVPKRFDPVGPGGVVKRVSRNGIWSWLSRALDKYESVMLLATCGYMLKEHLIWIRQHGIPYHNPYRTAAEGKTWNPLRSKDADMWRAFLRPSRTGKPRWSWKEVYRFAKVCYSDKIFIDEFAKNRVINHRKHNTAMPHGDLILRAEFIDAAMEGDGEWFYRSMVRNQRLNSSTAVTAQGYMKRLGDKLFEQPRLVVGTIHSVKGGEADAVCLLPNLSPGADKAMRGSVKGRDGVLRTIYVGMSRARKELALVSMMERRTAWK